MKLLLDTHAAIWWQREDERLGREARRAIATADVVWVRRDRLGSRDQSGAGSNAAP